MDTKRELIRLHWMLVRHTTRRAPWTTKKREWKRSKAVAKSVIPKAIADRAADGNDLVRSFVSIRVHSRFLEVHSRLNRVPFFVSIRVHPWFLKPPFMLESSLVSRVHSQLNRVPSSRPFVVREPFRPTV
jgi:hypothetical protein